MEMVITVFEHGGFLLEVAHVLVIDVDVYERAQLAVLSVKVALQVGMPRDQASERFATVFAGTSIEAVSPNTGAAETNLDLGHVNKDAMVLAKDASGKLSDHTHLLVHKFLVGLVAGQAVRTNS